MIKTSQTSLSKTASLWHFWSPAFLLPVKLEAFFITHPGLRIFTVSPFWTFSFLLHHHLSLMNSQGGRWLNLACGIPPKFCLLVCKLTYSYYLSSNTLLSPPPPPPSIPTTQTVSSPSNSIKGRAEPLSMARGSCQKVVPKPASSSGRNTAPPPCGFWYSIQSEKFL